jgi:GT2 family glycosyltransferase
MSRPLRYAVIPTRDREAKYLRCVQAIRAQVDGLITVAHMDAPYAVGHVLPYRADPPNISRMWNLGLSAAASLADDAPHEVAILNDDVVVPPRWFDTLSAGLAANGHVLGSGRWPRSPTPSMCGAAFLIHGNTIRPNEAWPWYGSDDWLEHEAERSWGGWTRLPDLRIEHDHEDLPPGELRRLARADSRAWMSGERR